jgi:hypothetical protein
MRFIAPALLFVPLFVTASPQYESLKTMDGGVLYCQSETVGQIGYRLENTLVEMSAKDAQTLEVNFAPNFYRCAKSANGYQWQPSSVTAFLSQSVKTDAGIVKIVPTSYAWVVYSENYTELNPQPSVKVQGGQKYIVTINDLLSDEQKSNRQKGIASRGILTVFMKYVTKAVYPDGREENLGLRATSSFNIVITLSQEGTYSVGGH